MFAGTTLNCKNTQFGCCPDNVTAKNVYGSNCPLPNTSPIVNVYGSSGPGYSQSTNLSQPIVASCSTTQYGCCPDNITAKNADASNCMGTQIGGCAGTQYGCCPDNITAKHFDGSNCSPYPHNKSNLHTNTVFIPPPRGGNKVENNSYDTSSAAVEATNTYTCPQAPPCPPCGRCPEPSFDCKKVPNYSSTKSGSGSDYLPTPVLSDFSQFGM